MEFQERIEGIKAEKLVPEILHKYGVEVRRGRCRGICHNGKDMNAKVYKDHLHCYVCGKSMDVFAITQHFEGCDFWTAFELLGGTERPSWRTTVMAARSTRERKQREEQEVIEKKRRRFIAMHITAYRKLLVKERPFSDLWCYYQNKLQYQIYLLENIMELDQ